MNWTTRGVQAENKAMKEDRGREAWRENVSCINLLVETLTEWLRDTGVQEEQAADV